tara:strand:+ start:484 stop:708 length:225 start_codon:yes stop_codon:yes gene_type:complete
MKRTKKGDIVNYRNIEYRIVDLGTSSYFLNKELRNITVAYLTETNNPKNKNVKRDIVYSKDITITLDDLKKTNN